MGRKRIKIEPLPELQIKAKFKKRKDGLRNKAFELGTLCHAQVALLVFSKDGDEVIEDSVNGSMNEILQRYLRHVERQQQQRRGQRREQPSHTQQLCTQPQVPPVQATVGVNPHGLSGSHCMQPQMRGDIMGHPLPNMQFMGALLHDDMPHGMPHVNDDYVLHGHHTYPHGMQDIGPGYQQQFVPQNHVPQDHVPFQYDGYERQA